MTIKRSLVAGLSLSAAALVGIAVHEGYVWEAMRPTFGDRCTGGFGSTFNADGTPVECGDRLDPVRALVTMQAHISKDEARFRETLPGVELFQHEYDAYLDFTYQYGLDAWRGSSMRRHVLAERYTDACDALLMYRSITRPQPGPQAGWVAFKFDKSGKPTRWKFDCSLPGNRVCAGVWTRQKERHAACLGVTA